MTDTPDAFRAQRLLDELLELLAEPGPKTGQSPLAVRLAAWREEMDLVRPEFLGALPPQGWEDLARRARVAQARLAECLRQREKARRALLIRALSCQAAQKTLNSYRRPPVASFFSRTV